MFTVEPESVISNGYAKIKNTGSSSINVTITSQSGDQQTITVEPNETKSWNTPSGWTTARFNAGGSQEEFRVIEGEGEAGA